MMLYCPVVGSSLAGWYRGGTDRVLTAIGGPLPAGDRWRTVQITPTDCRLSLTSLSWFGDASSAPLCVPGSSASRAALGRWIALLPPPPKQSQLCDAAPRTAGYDREYRLRSSSEVSHGPASEVWSIGAQRFAW